ncbi:hypothetical protein V6N11_059617 [Hibiscus sabdariffa]|uniref:Uncharacterized protein n=1 Tax=Hibiscus sabdariffa TaxID=183260 RepID=A0ABR2NXJ9_9ROSI
MGKEVPYCDEELIPTARFGALILVLENFDQKYLPPLWCVHHFPGLRVATVPGSDEHLFDAWSNLKLVDAPAKGPASQNPGLPA